MPYEFPGKAQRSAGYKQPAGLGQIWQIWQMWKLLRRNIVNYVGVGSFGGEDVDLCNIMSTTAEVMELLESMFLVQEYVEGGSLRDRVSADVRSFKHH